MINGRWIFVPFYSFFRSLLPNNAVIFIFLGTRSDNPLFFHTPSTSFCQSIKDEKISQKSVLAPPKKCGPPCVMSSACETIIHYSPVWRVMCLTLLEITPLYGRSNLIFFSSFSLPFLYSWRHRIILPILEWLQQRHCYSQGAVSPRCNSIHSQLDWPVIYRKSSPSE